ncbi:hypothetical protein OKW46_000997 [Paraburkholderia sp. WSM4179]|nr:hypothetical protein [Paraburkholderia sp. WSM4179]
MERGREYGGRRVWELVCSERAVPELVCTE